MKRKSPQFRKISETHRKIATAACEVIALPDSHCCTILENISEGVFTIDLKKRITYFNPAAGEVRSCRKCISRTRSARTLLHCLQAMNKNYPIWQL